MNNTGSIIKIVCWTLIGLLLIALLVVGLTMGSISNFFYNLFNHGIHIGGSSSYNNEFVESGVYTVRPENIENIDIDWVSGYVKVVPYDGNDIVITEKASYAIDASHALHYSASGNTLHIEYSDSFIINFPFVKTVDVQVPAALMNELDTIEVSSVSGSVEVSDATLEDLNIDTTSGAIDISNINASSKIVLNTTSGRIQTVNCVSPKLDTDGVSGAVNAQGTFTEITNNTVSGKIELESTVCPDKIVADSVSGAINITVPENSGFTLSISKVSGSLNCEFPLLSNGNVTTVGDGSSRFKVSTISGSVSIYSSAN